MSLVGFELTIPAKKQPQTGALDRTVTGNQEADLPGQNYFSVWMYACMSVRMFVCMYVCVCVCMCVCVYVYIYIYI